MAEQYNICRYWPHCKIHRHMIPPRFFSQANHAEIFRLWVEGAGMAELAKDFDTTRSTISRICRGEANRLRKAYAQDLEEAGMG